jgi:low affinity Fe/Cu permease
MRALTSAAFEFPQMAVKANSKAKHSSTTATNPSEWFGHFARVTANITGKPVVFLIAVAVIIVWAVTGPMFGYSDTWQLVINTGTTIVTFLMVFLIQNTQNRDQMAMQVKLGELILAARGAENRLAIAEDMTDEELEALHEECKVRADKALESLTARRNALAAIAEKSDKNGKSGKAGNGKAARRS